MQVRVVLQAHDALSLAGLQHLLAGYETTPLNETPDISGSDVIVAVIEKGPQLIETLSYISATDAPIILITDDMTESQLLSAVRKGVVSILLRPSLTAERLQRLVRIAAKGGGVLPPALVSRLLQHIQREVGNNSDGPRLSTREAVVLQLLSIGKDNLEIAQHLNYSERTVKGIIHTIVKRWGLRNRTHAVAYAVRQSLI